VVSLDTLLCSGPIDQAAHASHWIKSKIDVELAPSETGAVYSHLRDECSSSPGIEKLHTFKVY